MEGLSEGVIQFYSSQAELLIAQYEHINHLLGQTTDWTHPGTHCEVLLRDFLRRHLLFQQLDLFPPRTESVNAGGFQSGFLRTVVPLVLLPAEPFLAFLLLPLLAVVLAHRHSSGVGAAAEAFPPLYPVRAPARGPDKVSASRFL